MTQLGHIDAGRGREDLYRQKRASTLDRLVEVARIQSAESSNAIEGVTAPAARIKELMAERSEPRNRSEAQIAGYRSVLDLIHRSAPHIPLTPGIVRQFHRDLYQFSGVRGGSWKVSDNHIEAVLPDGTRSVVFRTTSFSETDGAMTELHQLMTAARDSGTHHKLLIAGAYVLDFLAIHPFLDGNGRVSRLLTLLLLYQAGYGVGRYVSLEKIVEETKDSYYEALRASSEGWHEGAHDPWHWLEYFLGVVLAAYDRLESRVDAAGAHGRKAEAIEEYVGSLPRGFVFRIADVRHVAVGASDSHIQKTLGRLRDSGAITRRGAGRTAAWEKLTDDTRAD